MTRYVTCTVCGERIGYGPGGMGIKSHAGKHKRQYERRFGTWPDDYQQVRDRLGDAKLPDSSPGTQKTLSEL